MKNYLLLILLVASFGVNLFLINKETKSSYNEGIPVLDTAAFYQSNNLLPDPIKIYPYSSDTSKYWQLNFYPNASLHSLIYYSKQNITGPVATFSSNGNLRSIGEFNNHARQGYWYFYDEKNLIRKTFYINGLREGMEINYNKGKIDTTILINDVKIDVK